jgi:hypothetical protein
VLGVEVFAARAGLSTRQISVPPRRSASPIAEGLNGLPKRPPQTRLRACRPLRQVRFSLARSAKPLRLRASEPGIAPRTPSADSFLCA